MWGLDDLLFTTQLIVSELVTNAIRYGRPPMELGCPEVSGQGPNRVVLRRK
jgi:two-component sensor histidine kinase